MKVSEFLKQTGWPKEEWYSMPWWMQIETLDLYGAVTFSASGDLDRRPFEVEWSWERDQEKVWHVVGAF